MKELRKIIHTDLTNLRAGILNKYFSIFYEKEGNPKCLPYIYLTLTDPMDENKLYGAIQCDAYFGICKGAWPLYHGCRCFSAVYITTSG